MTLREILKEAMDIASSPISDSDFLKMYNRAIHELSMAYDTAKDGVTQEIIVEDLDNEYELIPRILKIERVLDSKGNNFIKYKVRRNAFLLFKCKDTFTVYGLVECAKAVSMSDAPAINPAYHMCIAKHIAAKVLKQLDKEKSNELMAEFVSDASAANNNIRGSTNRYKRVKVYLWR